jgi:tetratricopeptide (TPR) repeat protein
VILTVIISVYQLYRVSTTESTPIVPVGDIPKSGAPALPPADTNRQIQEQITLGDGFFVKGDANSALDAYSKALQLDPKNNRAYQGVSQAREAALAAQKTQVALHYITAGNREVVSDIWAELRDTLKPMEVLSPDLAKGSTRGEIWYYSSENEKIAASVKKSVEFVLARTGFKVELKTVLRPAPSGSKKNTIEIWLPDLKPGVTKS